MPDKDIAKQFLERFPLIDENEDGPPLIIRGQYYLDDPLRTAIMAAILELDRKLEISPPKLNN